MEHEHYLTHFKLSNPSLKAKQKQTNKHTKITNGTSITHRENNQHHLRSTERQVECSWDIYTKEANQRIGMRGYVHQQTVAKVTKSTTVIYKYKYKYKPNLPKHKYIHANKVI